MYLNDCVCDEFLSFQKWQKITFSTSSPTCMIHPYFVCKCSFREISIIKIIILDQSKPISLILKKEKSKIQKIINCTFIIQTR